MSAAPNARAVAVALGMVAIQFVMVTAFAWPAARLAPRHLPLVVAGPAAPAAAVARQLSHAHPGAFEFVTAPTAAQAQQDIADRRAYGAIVLGGKTPRMLVASAASPLVAQLLKNQVADQLAGVRSPVRDVVPTDPNDPHGAAFSSLLLPLVITSIIAGLLLSLRVSSATGRLAGLAVFCVGGGAVTAAIAKSWLAILPGGYYTVAAVTGLTTLAVSAFVTGLGALAGRAGRALAGVGAGTAIMLILGNPLSGATSAPELLPRPWGQIGQALPPGAAATLFRAVEYFNGARAAVAWTVLASWAAAGVLLVIASGARRRTRHTLGATAAQTTERPAV